VIFLFILSHGGPGGKIYTEKLLDESQNPNTADDTDFEYFLSSEICETLKKVPALENSLKVIFFGVWIK